MSVVSDRFFDSINYPDAKAVGLTFLEYKKVNNVWHYTLLKEKPWKFSDYYVFSNALLNIAYEYVIHFAYTKLPDVNDAISLFHEWYEHNNYRKSDYVLIAKNNSVVFSFDDEIKAIDAKGLLQEYKYILQELSYNFMIESNVVASVDEDEAFTMEANDSAPFIFDEGDEPEEEEFETGEDVSRSIEAHADIKDQLSVNYLKMINDRKKGPGKRVYEAIEISEITPDKVSKNIDFDGQIYSYERRPAKSSTTYNFGVGKHSGAVMVRVRVNKRGSELDLLLKRLEVGSFVRVQGDIQIDNYRGSRLFVNGRIVEEVSPPPLPEDNYDGEKRIELHLHTKMSSLDAVSSIDEYVALAKNMGHKAIALTDHGVVQAFPEAQKAGKKHDIKIIYGSELYVIDEHLKFINNPTPTILSTASYVIFDLETTGLSARYNEIIEIGAVRVDNGFIGKRLNILINPGKGKLIPPHITRITNITNEMVKGKPILDDVLDEILEFFGDAILVSHNAEFDLGFLNANLKARGRETLKNPTIDTLTLSRYLFPQSRGHSLGVLARNLDVVYDEEAAHRADFDAEVLNSIWQAMLTKLTSEDQFLTHSNLANLKLQQESIQFLRPVHATVYVKNHAGLKDLYKIVSVSHTEFSTDIPKTPRSLLAENRDNFLIGSGCFNGEVFQTAARFDEDALLNVMGFYDFIEIQPFENYSYLVHMGELDSEDHLKKVIADIKSAAQKLGKPLVATGDVHYAVPDQKIYRDVYIVAKGLKGVKHPLNPYSREKKPVFENPSQHYRSTTEMFEEMRRFDCFSEEELTNMIITVPHKINDLIDTFDPFSKELHKPSIENVDQLLSDLVYNTANEMYGDPLPSLISERITRELDGIINNGYAVIYYLAHQIVKKATDNNYIVGSRGSVGSSVVALFAKVSEVNPLPPHYYCPQCKHSDFHNEHKVLSGFDLAPKDCPKCGVAMKRDGQNIPFETFLGFEADKIPDIDLNFPEDFQKEAHNYTKVLFGEQNAFRAGTIQTVAAKTAYGYVLNYFESKGQYIDEISSESVAFLASHVAGVKRTTGQHPGGIMVIPSEYEVYNFTPVQYPAGNTESDWLTTHFDYGSLHDNLLKLDLLGHKDPVALKMLCDLTGVSFNDVPTNDPGALSLFSSVEALKLKNNPLNEITGALSLPEFGTQFVRQILVDAQPKNFNDLVIISGLSHGTGVWRFNADDLIKSGQATLTGVIGCRDDIMTYLISQNMNQKDAFTIMELVRKGKNIPPSLEQAMRDAGVPNFYIESCQKIEYLFPRAHAVAYVIMAVKVAWFKLHHPLEYYATFFTIRGDSFDIKTMTSGESEILRVISEFKEKEQTLNPRDQNILENLQLTIEMINRGYNLSKVDIYKSLATEFVVDKENKQIIPPFTVIKALGEGSAQSVVDERKKGEFISIEDLVARTKLNTSNIESLKEIGSLKDLPESNQISLFEFDF